MVDFNHIDIVGCSSSNNYAFEAVNPTGRLGGLIFIWNPTLFANINSITSMYYIAIVGHWKGFPGITIVVNVYAPKSITSKRAFWAELHSLKNVTFGI